MRAILLVLINLSLLLAQPRLDSLLSALKGKDDTIQIRKLINLCWEYRSIYPRVSIMYGETALKMISNETDQHYKSEVLNYLGVIYGNLGQLDSAYSYYRKAIQVSKGINDDNQIAYSLNNLGDYYFKNALYSTALEKIIEACEIFEKTQNKQGLAYTYNDMGEIYLVQKDYSKALDYFKKAAQLRLERKDNRGYAKTLINMANTYDNLLQYDKAFEAFDMALEASEKSDYVKGKSWIFAGISDLYFKQENYYYALDNCQKAIAIDTQIGNKYGEIINYNRLGQIYMKLGQKQKSREFLEKARMESQKTGHIDQLMHAYRYITDLYINEGDYKSAYFSLKEYEKLNERIFSQQNINKIADLQTAFVIEKKDRENEILKKDIEYQKGTRNYILLISALILGVVGLILARYKSEKKANQLLKELNSSKDKFYSIIAHDLKSPIGALSNLADILKTDYDELEEEERKSLINSVSEASVQVKRLLIDLLTWANTQKGGLGLNLSPVNIKTILESICSSNQLMAKNKNITLRVEADDSLTVNGDRYIIETITGNLVSNAIKFSFNKSDIIIRAKRTDNRVDISVTDFGKGIADDIRKSLLKVETKISTPGTNHEKGTGLGLKICKEFAELHNGSIAIESEPGKGSTFTFSFPA